MIIHPSPTPFGYRDATGARHQVLVRQSPEGAWQVLDIIVVETLTGVGEGRARGRGHRTRLRRRTPPPDRVNPPPANRSAA